MTRGGEGAPGKGRGRKNGCFQETRQWLKEGQAGQGVGAVQGPCPPCQEAGLHELLRASVLRGAHCSDPRLGARQERPQDAEELGHGPAGCRGSGHTAVAWEQVGWWVKEGVTVRRPQGEGKNTSF